MKSSSTSKIPVESSEQVEPLAFQMSEGQEQHPEDTGENHDAWLNRLNGIMD